MRTKSLIAAAMLGLPGLVAAGDNAGPPSGGTKAVASAEPQPRYGELMSEVGHRFETMGRAVKAHRYELAAFQLDELEEVFEEDLPRAERPKVPTEVNLNGLAEAFRTTHPPELDAAIKAHDQRAFAKAFGRAAETCNGCHKATGHPFIEVPSAPGSAVPRMDPIPDQPAPRPVPAK
jgi:hypothetical protein